MCGALFWVSGGEWECMGHYFGRVRVGGALFWVGGGGWGWGGVSGDEWGWVGVGALFDNAPIQSIFLVHTFSKGNSLATALQAFFLTSLR